MLKYIDLWIDIFTYTGFAIVDSRTCESNGMQMISSKKECENAAMSLGLRRTSAIYLSNELRATGCIFNPTDHWLIWHDSTNDIPCGAIDTSHRDKPSYNCICKQGKIKYVDAYTMNCLNFYMPKFLPRNSWDVHRDIWL